MSCKTIASLGLFVLAVAFAVAPARAQTALFEGARVIPGDGSAAIENAAFFVERGAITRIGRKGDVALPAANGTTKLSGRVGQFCAVAGRTAHADAMTNAAARTLKWRNVIIVVPPSALPCANIGDCC